MTSPGTGWEVAEFDVAVAGGWADGYPAAPIGADCLSMRSDATCVGAGPRFPLAVVGFRSSVTGCRRTSVRIAPGHRTAPSTLARLPDCTFPGKEAEAGWDVGKGC